MREFASRAAPHMFACVTLLPRHDRNDAVHDYALTTDAHHARRFDGHFGTESLPSRLVIALALLAGLLLTTMPITILGGAFASAWEQKEVVEVV